jgi:hypothetical protein
MANTADLRLHADAADRERLPEDCPERQFRACNVIYGMVGTTLGSRYSAIVSPEPPNSAGTSLNFGKPSRMGSTVSA